MGFEHPVILPDRKIPDPLPDIKMPFFRKKDMSRPPRILPGKILIEIQTVSIHVHELPHDFFPGLHLILGNIDVIFREPPLQTLLQNSTITPCPFFVPANQRMEVRIVHGNHPYPHAGNLRAYSHTIPSEHFVFHRIERYVRPRSVRIYMPYRHNPQFGRRYDNLSVYAKCRRINSKNRLPRRITALFTERFTIFI